jgi:hypothetical protein
MPETQKKGNPAVMFGVAIIGGGLWLASRKPGNGNNGNGTPSVITFGPTVVQTMPGVDPQGYVLGWYTLSLSCSIQNVGPDTIRSLEIWIRQMNDNTVPGFEPVAGPVGGVRTLSIPADSSAVFSYSGNPIGSDSILLQVHTTYEFWLKDIASGKISAAASSTVP